MVMADDRPSNELESREPTVEDLRDLCRELNQRGAKYVVVGGFAIRAASYIRQTMDVDLIVAAVPKMKRRYSPRFPLCRTMPCVNFNRASFSNTMSSAWPMKSSWT